MEQYLNYYMEDEATTSAGDMAVHTPVMGQPKKRKGMEDELEEKPKTGRQAVLKRQKRTTMVNKEIRADIKKYGSLDAALKAKKTEELEETTQQKDPNMIEETATYKYYNDGDRKVFEMLDESDFHKFYQGLKRGNNRFWRNSPMMGGSPTTEKMMEKMNENRGLWFEVRYDNRIYKPFDKGF